jgi:hypothetical protein
MAFLCRQVSKLSVILQFISDFSWIARPARIQEAVGIGEYSSAFDTTYHELTLCTAAPPLLQPLRIFSGPPSAIRQHTRGSRTTRTGTGQPTADQARTRPSFYERIRGSGAAAASSSRAAPAVRPTPAISSAATRIHRRTSEASLPHEGHRDEREMMLMHSDLYLDAMRPPDLDDVKDIHKCALCFSIKSHPVS